MRTSGEVRARMLEIEATLGRTVTHREIGRAVNEELRSAPSDDPDSDPLVWEAWAFDLMLTDPGDYREQWGPLAPMLVFPPKVYSPPMDHFPEEALDHFDRRLAESSSVSAKARLADILWLRRRDVRHADMAVSAYLDAATLVMGQDDLGATSSLDYLQRAQDLIKSLGRDDASHAVDTALHLIDRFVSDDRWGLVCASIRLSHQVLATRDEAARILLEKCLGKATEFAKAGGSERFPERDLIQAAADLATSLGDHARASELRQRIPRSLEQEALERSDEGGLVEAALLEDALRAYANLGMSEDISRLKRLLHTATQRTAGEMKVVSASLNISIAQIEEEVDRLLESSRQTSEWHHLYVMGCSQTLWPSWKEVRERQRALTREFPLQSLVRKGIISADGRPLPRPTEEDAAREFDEIERFTQDQQILLALQLVRVEALRERGAWSVDLLHRALAEGDLYEESMLRAIDPGLRAFEDGRYWDSVHLLSPQIERVIRQIGQLRGTETLRYRAGKGELRWASLEQMLEDPLISEVLDAVRPDLARELTYCLVDSRGWNIRNVVAHGIATVDEDGTAAESLLLILVLLCLAALRVNSSPQGNR